MSSRFKREYLEAYLSTVQERLPQGKSEARIPAFDCLITPIFF